MNLSSKKILATSKISLEKKAVKQNVNFVKSQISESTVLSAVVKGNAYGHGIQQMIPLFEKSGINHFSVFSAHEAFEVCEVKSVHTEVMIMGWIDDQSIEWAVENGISFYIFEQERLQRAIEAAKLLNKHAKIHIEFETGMNRTGVEEEYFPEVVDLINNNTEHLILEGFCTHYAGAEAIANYLRVQDQMKNFYEYVEYFKKHGIAAKKLHTACSAALISYPETQMDMVRVGILLYGFWPSKETFIYHQRHNNKTKNRAIDPLKRVIKWTSKIMSIKNVPIGDFIGYGTSYQAAKDMKVASVPVGYAYGFARSLSNQGRVIIKGKRVAVIGTINMNLLMIDISEVKGVNKGDEVILIGNKGKVEVSVASFGELSNQLNYELLSRLPQDIPREIY